MYTEKNTFTGFRLNYMSNAPHSSLSFQGNFKYEIGNNLKTYLTKFFLELLLYFVSQNYTRLTSKLGLLVSLAKTSTIFSYRWGLH